MKIVKRLYQNDKTGRVIGARFFSKVVDILALTLRQQKFPWEAEYYKVEDEDEIYYVYIKVAKEEELLCPEDCEMYCKTIYDEEGNRIKKGE